MFNRWFFLFLLGANLCAHGAYCQNDDFCKAVTAITNDAPNSFRNIKGAPFRAKGMWESGIKVPGTIASRFVLTMGLYYEGAFFQTKDKTELMPAYEKYSAILKGCLLAHGYTVTAADNFYPGLGDFKKLIFMVDDKDEPVDPKANGKHALPPAHISMEVEYNKEVNKYTIVMFIFEH